VNRRAASGLFFGASYTWSKVLTTAVSDTAYVRSDNFTRQANYGPATFDRRQVFALNYVYNTPNIGPGNRVTHAITNGWQISGLMQMMTGLPFTPTFTVSGAGTQNITGNILATNPAFGVGTTGTAAYNASSIGGISYEGPRIGYVKGCNPYTNSSDPFNRLNAACFFAPRPGSLGLESGLDWLYQPGLINFDVSLQKQFAIAERVHLQFRVDAFNVFNHPNFTGLNGTLNFTSYPNPVLANNATPYNAAGQLVNVTGFGAATVPAIGAGGGPRTLQTLIRITF
jgi:hypothetical protein